MAEDVQSFEDAPRDLGQHSTEPDATDVCRYCFDNEGELLADVCDCKGDQRFVHLKCLREWQRMVLVSQPTHPMLYDQDVRQQRCNVCSSQFRCEPPTRHELMSSFAGEEITQLICEGSFIANRVEFDDDDENEHWRQSAYLIIRIDPGEDTHRLIVDSTEDLDALKRKLVVRNGETRVYFMGKPMKLVRGTLNDTTPVLFILKDVEMNEGDDCVLAVNLSRPKLLSEPQNSGGRLRIKLAEHKAWREFELRFGSFCVALTRQLCHIEHYIGGPIDETKISHCIIVLDDEWHVAGDLVSALAQVSTKTRRTHKKMRVTAGAYTRLCVPGHRGLDGQLVYAMQQAEDQENAEDDRSTYGDWLVRVTAATLPVEDVAPFPAAAAPHARVIVVDRSKLIDTASTVKHLREGAHSDAPVVTMIYAFWGYAAWSRTQLLAETARGHWGLCRAAVEDLKHLPAASRRAALDDRLVFAPISAMTDAAVANV